MKNDETFMSDAEIEALIALESADEQAILNDDFLYDYLRRRLFSIEEVLTLMPSQRENLVDANIYNLLITLKISREQAISASALFVTYLTDLFDLFRKDILTWKDCEKITEYLHNHANQEEKFFDVIIMRYLSNGHLTFRQSLVLTDYQYYTLKNSTVEDLIVRSFLTTSDILYNTQKAQILTAPFALVLINNYAITPNNLLKIGKVLVDLTDYNLNYEHIRNKILDCIMPITTYVLMQDCLFASSALLSMLVLEKITLDHAKKCLEEPLLLIRTLSSSHATDEEILKIKWLLDNYPKIAESFYAGRMTYNEVTSLSDSMPPLLTPLTIKGFFSVVKVATGRNGQDLDEEKKTVGKICKFLTERRNYIDHTAIIRSLLTSKGYYRTCRMLMSPITSLFARSEHLEVNKIDPLQLLRLAIKAKVKEAAELPDVTVFQP